MNIGKKMQALLNDAGINIIEHGEATNVKRGNFNIQCPFCGSDDPSAHMGINYASGMWGCWRNTAHRGRAPEKLIAKALHVSTTQARLMLGLTGQQAVESSDFGKLLSGAIFSEEAGDVERTSSRKSASLQERFKLVRIKDTGATSKFFDYLCSRNFDSDEDVWDLIGEYGIMGCLVREYANRLILPIRRDGKLVAFTGRSIFKEAKLRYRAVSDDDAIVRVKDCLFNEEQVGEGGDVLVVQEGPLDVYKLDFYGRKYGVRSVGLMTTALTAYRIAAIRRLSKKYRVVVVMQDKGMEIHAHQVAAQFILDKATKLTVQHVPGKWKDVGDMGKKDVVKLCKQLTKLL